jgi:hypothetical protein
MRGGVDWRATSLKASFADNALGPLGRDVLLVSTLSRLMFAVDYLRNGGNLYYLQRILGYSTITTTERYLRSLGIADLQGVHDVIIAVDEERYR